MCSMSFSIEKNGKTIEPLNFPVFSIPMQTKDLPTLIDGSSRSQSWADGGPEDPMY